MFPTYFSSKQHIIHTTKRPGVRRVTVALIGILHEHSQGGDRVEESEVRGGTKRGDLVKNQNDRKRAISGARIRAMLLTSRSGAAMNAAAIACVPRDVRRTERRGPTSKSVVAACVNNRNAGIRAPGAGGARQNDAEVVITESVLTVRNRSGGPAAHPLQVIAATKEKMIVEKMPRSVKL